MMDGHYVLILVGRKAWYHWSASKVLAVSSQGFRSYGLCDGRALSVPHRRGREGCQGVTRGCLFW
jgi:hypothetical protein